MSDPRTWNTLRFSALPVSFSHGMNFCDFDSFADYQTSLSCSASQFRCVRTLRESSRVFTSGQIIGQFPQCPVWFKVIICSLLESQLSSFDWHGSSSFHLYIATSPAFKIKMHWIGEVAQGEDRCTSVRTRVHILSTHRKAWVDSRYAGPPVILALRRQR